VIGVDITQAAGLIDYDCQASGCGFRHVSTSLKWMCGSPGGGILQVMPDVIARCQPSLTRLVQPGKYLLLGHQRFRLCSRHPPVRQWHAGGDGLRGQRSGAGMACGAGLGCGACGKPGVSEADHRSCR
jgi:hypothetical protein